MRRIASTPCGSNVANWSTLATVAVALVGWSTACTRNLGTASGQPSDSAAQTTNRQDESASQDQWYICQFHGQKMGHLVRRVQRRTDALHVRWSLDMSLEMLRSGQPICQRVELFSIESPEGELVECGWTAVTGPDRQSCCIRIEGDRAVVDMHPSADRSGVPEQLPWSKYTRGYFAVEQSLLNQPMQPGETRRIPALLPLMNQVGSYDLRAGDYVHTTLLDSTAELLEVDVTVTGATTKLMSYTVWMDRQGAVIKQYTPGTEQTILLVDRAKALAPSDGRLVDVGLEMLIPTEGLARLAEAHEPVSYLFSTTLDSQRDWMRLFASTPWQACQAQESGDLLVTVWSPAAAREQSLPVTAEYRLGDADRAQYLDATPLVQSDHPELIAMAWQGAPDGKPAAELARLLERHVHRRIAVKNYSRAFVSALDVARNEQGDCTEHAVLLAALCRARGIPARGVFGLVALPAHGGLGFHMWTEAWTGEQWLPLDATLGRGTTTTGHITLAHTAIAEDQIWNELLRLLPLLRHMSARVVHP